MAAGDIIMSQASGGAPSFPCGGCQKCHDLLGDNLAVVISGVTVCMPCLSNGTLNIAVTFTGINGAFTAVWDAGSSTWIVTVGTVTKTRYPDGTDGGGCTGDPTIETKDAILTISCSGDNALGANISAAGFDPDPIEIEFIDAAGTINAAMTNTNGCGFNGDGSILLVGTVGSGTVTVTFP